MLKTFLIILHFVLLCVIILFVLLHQGTGAEAGMSFRNNKTSHIIFGSRGSDSFFFITILFLFIFFLVTTVTLTKITTIKKTINAFESIHGSVENTESIDTHNTEKNSNIFSKDKKLPKISI